MSGSVTRTDASKATGRPCRPVLAAARLRLKKKSKANPNPSTGKKPLAFARPRGPECASRKKIPNCRRCVFFDPAQSRVLSGKNARHYDGSASGALYLDTPRVITDAAGNKVWEWQNIDPFGNNVPNENPSGLGTFKFDLRYPGMTSDVETGLFQNHFRDYNPAIGGYPESDPIGLAGGSFSTYTYVGGNPLRYVDPKGLAGVLPGPIPLPIPGPVNPPGSKPKPAEPLDPYIEQPTTNFPPSSPPPPGPRPGCRAMFESCMKGANVCPVGIKQGMYGICLAAFFACQAMDMGDGGSPPGAP
jgi:RHS repeat-associated protein